MNEEIVNELKKFDWQKIIDFGNSLEELNDSQWRFLKGLTVELAVEKFADGNLKYVGAVHKDYDWPKFSLSGELKSQFSTCMYNKKGKMAKHFGIKLNNSMGTNKKAVLNPNDVADFLIVVRSDGAFVIDKATVLENAKSGGDGFEVKVNRDQVIEISGKISNKIKYSSNIKQTVIDGISKALSSL